ncbi:RCC1 and BTB domain-containing protein [Acrasis kona]|uniref:RCC1 and BTB domain-containing protein n=1 Tax=Acrasis kona TaxID=1008807 RepID=A0AAW2Z7S0_9EUKA
MGQSASYISPSTLKSISSTHENTTAYYIGEVRSAGGILKKTNTLAQLNLNLKSTSKIIDRKDGEIYCLKKDVIKRLLPNVFVSDISCGPNHCLAVDDNGILYSWGLNNEFGQLGREYKFNKPTKVDGINDPVIMIATGWSTSFALTNKGVLYAWGACGCGQLAIDSKILVSRPKRVKILSEVDVKKICCGMHHTLALSEQGSVFVWGKTALRSTPDPMPVPFDEKICDIFSSSSLCFAKTVSGLVYIWGTTRSTYTFPILLNTVDGAVIDNVWTDCMSSYVMLKTTCNRLFFFGESTSYDLSSQGQRTFDIKSDVRATEVDRFSDVAKGTVIYCAFGEESLFVLTKSLHTPYQGMLQKLVYSDIRIDCQII